MASPKKKAAASRAAMTSRAKAGREVEEHEDDVEGEEAGRAAFDHNAFFADAGLKYTEEDLADVGGLMAIYASAHAYEEEWPPLFGLLHNRIQIEVDKTAALDKDRWRWFYVVEAEVATKALAGTKDDREAISIEPGDYVLMPESGALKNRERLKMAAVDTDKIHRVFFRVTGQLDLGKPGRNDMWEIECKLINDPLPRTGRFVIENTARERPALPEANGVLGGGITNKRTGAPAGSLIGQG